MTTCKSCRWWEREPPAITLPNRIPNYGWCHYNPPVAQQTNESNAFPCIGEDDWCRMYQHSKKIAITDEVTP